MPKITKTLTRFKCEVCKEIGPYIKGYDFEAKDWYQKKGWLIKRDVMNISDISFCPKHAKKKYIEELKLKELKSFCR